jgi:hypothetical protein
VIGQQFAIGKRRVALFCVALCIALSVQITMVVLDRMKHTFQIAHAPSALAGDVFEHGHHLTIEVPHEPRGAHPHAHNADGGHGHGTGDAAHRHADDHGRAATAGFHTHDWLPEGHDHGPIGHHHHGTGMLTPWLVSAPVDIAAIPLQVPVIDYGLTGHADAPEWRRDRPPKSTLERFA